MKEKIDLPRRGFLGTAALTLAAAQFGLTQAAHAQSSLARAAALPATTLARIRALARSSTSTPGC